jgi:hypothetical protein
MCCRYRVQTSAWRPDILTKYTHHFPYLHPSTTSLLAASDNNFLAHFNVKFFGKCNSKITVFLTISRGRLILGNSSSQRKKLSGLYRIDVK